MKNIRAIYIVGAVMALAGCTNQELSSDMTLSYTPKSISVGVNSVSFGAKDNLTATLPVKAVNTSWNISGEPEGVAVPSELTCVWGLGRPVCSWVMALSLFLEGAPNWG